MAPSARRPSPLPCAGTLRHVLVVLDYDGTATTHECNEIALTEVVGDAWRPFEEMVHRGEIGHAECFDRQLGLVDAPRAAFLGRLVEAAEPAPGLREFLTVASAGGARVAIVSAGFREAIEAVWRDHGLPPVEIVASELEGAGPDGGPPYSIRFSALLGDCARCGPASCKAAVLRARRRADDVVWVFGDGESDFCPAREADLVFARGRLGELAEEAGLERRPLDFVAAAAGLAGLARPTPPTLRERLRPHTRQFVKFAIVGGSGTIVNLLALKLTLLLWGVLPPSQTFAVELGASALAFCIAVGNNYLLNRWWTFRSRAPIHLEFGKFFTVSLIGLGLNALFFTTFRRYAELHVLWSQLLAIACVLPFNFLANKLWSFRER